MNTTAQTATAAARKEIPLATYGSMIPVKCFTCGKEISSIYEYYKLQVQELKKKDKSNAGAGVGAGNDDLVYLTKMTRNKKTPEGLVLDELELKVCCRRHMLTHVEIE